MKVAFVDIDGTLIKGQTQVHYLLFLLKKREIYFIHFLEVLFWYAGYKLLGKKINEELAKKIYLKIVKDKSEKEVSRHVDEYFEKIQKYIFKGAISLLGKLKEEGYEIVLLTSTLYPIAKKFQDYFDAKDFYSTRLESNNGIYTGQVEGGIVQGFTKLKLVKDFIKKNKPKQVMVLSDHVTDLPVLEIADRPVVINPDRKLLSFAKKRNWEIIKL